MINFLTFIFCCQDWL